jgi:glycosyltransferase involved in cell wall biosynthesis
LNQTYSNFEVIIVDDASTDDSIKKIKNKISNDRRWKLFENPSNNGCGYTKNRCAALATGEILGFLDPDDTLEPDALQIMIDAHKKHPKVAIVTSKFYFVDAKLKIQGVSKAGEKLPEGHSYLTYGKGAFTHFATFKKNYYNLTEGINVNFKRAVDQDLYYKLEEIGEHHFIDKALYNYRINNNSISANENVFKALYWHMKAMFAAYNRRKNKPSTLPNITKKKMNSVVSSYYIKRYEKVKGTKAYCDKLYFLFKSFLASRSHRISFKIKSLILVIIGRV